MKKKRRKNDFYPTPGAATLALLREFNPTLPTVLEPCAGAGDIAKVLIRSGFGVVTNDIDRRRVTSYHMDASKPESWPNLARSLPPYGWVITNPPFNQAFSIWKAAYFASEFTVALLLRISFLEPTYERGQLLSAYPPDCQIVLPRISFTGDGKTDSVTCAWYIWYNARTEQQKKQDGAIHVVSKEDFAKLQKQVDEGTYYAKAVGSR